MKDNLRPKRNLETEKRLKSLILEIEGMLQTGQEQVLIERKVEQAAKYVVAPGRLISLEVIKEYKDWTDLDTLVRDLTMEVPTDVHLTKDKFIELVKWIKENVLNRMEGDQQRYHRYYYDMLLFFAFPEKSSYDIMQRIEEGDPIEAMVAHLYPA